MKNLFEANRVEELKERLAELQSDSRPLWGKMNAAQAVAHCSAGIEMAGGKILPKRVLIGRILGTFVKPMAFKDEEPMRKNSPTIKVLLVDDERDLQAERERLCRLIDEFAAAGPGGCTAHPHPFFGRLTPQEWSGWMYKHLDHHLQQFGV